MAGAGYGAAGLMTWLAKRQVALQVLNVKKHRRYPDSDQPSSNDRRMMFLGIAVSAGVWGIKHSTALRKLAEAGVGLERMAREVHRMDNLQEIMKDYVWAEPAESYFVRSPKRGWVQIGKLPCKVPAKWQGGYIIWGHGQSGFHATFSRTLPRELL
jgi:hypothetical protein